MNWRPNPIPREAPTTNQLNCTSRVVGAQLLMGRVVEQSFIDADRALAHVMRHADGYHT
jgi:hypothetical protein